MTFSSLFQLRSALSFVRDELTLPLVLTQYGDRVFP